MARTRNSEPREAMITRTFKTEKCKVMCLNTETCKGEHVEIVLAETYNDNAKRMKAINREVKALNRPELIPCQIDKVEIVETLRGMTLSAFLAASVELPPRAKVEIENE